MAEVVTTQTILDAHYADAGALFNLLQSAALLSSYLAQGMMLSTEERSRVLVLAEKLKGIVMGAAADAGLTLAVNITATPGQTDRKCVKCGAVLLALPECPHCGMPIQEQPK